MERERENEGLYGGGNRSYEQEQGGEAIKRFGVKDPPEPFARQKATGVKTVDTEEKGMEREDGMAKETGRL